MRVFIKSLVLSPMVGVVFYSPASFAALNDPSTWKIPDLATMLQNLASNMGDLMQFVTALSYVMGMFFIVEGIMKLKKYGESKTSGSPDSGNLRSALIFMGVGGGLLYLPESVIAGIRTFWDVPTPYAYVTETLDPWAQLIQSVFIIIQLIGTIAFIRGLVVLSHVGGQGSQPGTFGRAMAHIIGGVLCINLYQFIQAIANTFGIGLY